MLGFRLNHEQCHLVLNIVAYLVVGEESAGAGEFARLSASVGLDSPVIIIIQNKRIHAPQKDTEQKVRPALMATKESLNCSYKTISMI
jgi:hypothetical protein